MHMLHGNGGPPWQTVGRVVGEGRLLQDLHPVGKLRAAGWRIPSEVDDKYRLRVYDTRPDLPWLQEVAAEAAGGRQLPVYVVGGDFLTRPHLEDQDALNPLEVRRWGPPGEAPYRLLIPPRPHMAEWAKRCVVQMKLEAPGTELVWCAVAPRDRYAPGMGAAGLKRLVPQAEFLLESMDLQVDVKVIGERAPLKRVPAKTNEKVLPPVEWERGCLPMDRVLVMVVVRLAAGSRQPPSCSLLRGDLPIPKSDGLELLRLEYVLPPSTKQANAEKALWGAVRKLAEAMQLPLPPGRQMLRQVVVQHGGVLANLSVPTAQAVEWLKGSGCGGLYIRPFWTASTDSSISREKFQPLWMRGQVERGPQLWEIFHRRAGVAGLLLSGRDIALRATSSANKVELQAQLDEICGVGSVHLRQAMAGQRRWRIGPMTAAESWRTLELVRSMGLEPLRGELTPGWMGRWRHCAYFSAVGSPTRTTLDDGSRKCSEAYLLEVGPQRRPPPRTGFAAAKAFAGPALTAESRWAGTWTSASPSPSDPAQVRPSSQPVPSSTSSFQQPLHSGPVAGGTSQQQRGGRSPRPPRGAAARDVPGGSPTPSTGTTGCQPAGDARPHAGNPSPGYGELLKLIEELRLELRALRRENELLRLREVPPFVSAPGATPQTPPRGSNPGVAPPVAEVTFPPLPRPNFSPIRPVAAMEVDRSAVRPREDDHGTADSQDAKRALVVVDSPNDAQ